MRKTRFTDERIVAILREADREPVAAVAKRHAVSEQTIYTWRKALRRLAGGRGAGYGTGPPCDPAHRHRQRGLAGRAGEPAVRGGDRPCLRGRGHSVDFINKPFEGGKVGPPREWCARRCLAVAVRGNAAGTVKESQIGLFLRQNRHKIAEHREDRGPDPPAVAVLHSEQRRLPQNLPRGHAGRELSPHGLGDPRLWARPSSSRPRQPRLRWPACAGCE